MDDQTRRDAINDADDTGMLAGEELITEAETLLPLQRPDLPRDDLHNALPADHGDHDTIDQLHAEIQKPVPDRGAIESHVGRLRVLPELEAIVVNWWDDPRVQRFVAGLNQIGL
jgi:hypothetical protein